MRSLLSRLTSHRPTTLVLLVLLFVAFASALTLWAQRDSADSGVRVREFRPQNTTDPRTNITIEFSDDLVPKDSLDQPVSNPPVQFDPPLSGVARWIEANTLRFFPDAPLNPATDYTARISSDRTWLEGRRIVEKRTFSFSTEPLTVVGLSSYTVPADDQSGRIRVFADIRFNYPVNVEELRTRLAITGPKDGRKSEPLLFDITGTVNITRSAGAEPATVDENGIAAVADYITVATEPLDQSDVEQTLQLTIEPGINCPNCGKPLEKKYTGSLPIPPRERFVIHSAESFTEGTRGRIAIYFSSPVLSDRASEFVTVDPAIPFRVESEWNRLELHGDFTPGETYTIAVESGLRSISGAALENDFSSRVTIRDVPPTVIFRSEGIYLPQTGNGLLEIETINLDTMTVEVEHIFANNIVYALAGGHTQSNPWGGQDISAVGRTFFSAKKALTFEKNQTLSTTVDIGAIIGDTARGIFKISARSTSSRWVSDSRLAMITDLGLIARMSGDYLIVWVNRLSTVEPVRNVDIRLYSKNNQPLLSGRTDSRGTVVFENIAEAIGDFEPYLITAELDKDLSYLRFSETQLNLSDFDIKGRPILTRGYEAFVYTDRGVYRPGETAHLAAITRTANGDVPDNFPYFLNVKDPTGRDFNTFRLNTGDEAFDAVDLSIPDYARTGKYTAIARIGDDLEIGRTEFQVEEFVPDRIKVTVATPKNQYTIGETVPITVTGEFLFGPPAAEHQATGRVQMENHSFLPDGFSLYNFTDSQRKFAARTENLPEAVLSREGTYTYHFAIPKGLTPPSALKALVGASVSEQGGRAVSGYKELIIHPYPRYLGLRLNVEGYVKPGESFDAHAVALDPSGHPTALANAVARLYRVVWNTVLTHDRQGRYRYKSERTETLIEEKSLSITETGATISFIAASQGAYRLTVADPDGGHLTDVEFYASGWGYAPWSMEQPERIEVGLDKESYRPGENALVQIRAPFGGKLLLTVEKQSVLETMVLDMTDNTAEITLKVKEDFFPNAYITAMVIKKANDIDRTSSARAFGIAPLILTKDGRDLNVKLDAPEVMKPRHTMAVDIAVGTPGPTLVTVAAVDAGILQLTGFTTPDPLDFFYGQRAPALRPYDIYSFIYPNLQPAASHLAPGGDRFFDAARKRHLNPFAALRVKPVALWSGIVTTDATGKATINFEIPEFNGRLTIIAVAAQGNRFGSASRDVTVREDLIVQESFPRFISPNDIVSGLATIFNFGGESREVTVQLEMTGPVEIVGEDVRRLTIPDGGESSVSFQFKGALEPGIIDVRLRATAGIDQTDVSFELPNRPGQPLLTRYGAGVITDSTAARIAIPNDFISGTTRLSLQTSSLNAVQFRRSIEYLLSYPYGCVEQTTSRVFPLLYFNDLARFVNPELLGGNSSDYFLQEGIHRLGTMVRSDGTFSFWPGGEQINFWASTYAGHFILEARHAGYAVDDNLYDLVRNRLHAWARGRNLGDENVAVRVYAAYALASTDQLDRKMLNELRQIPIASLSVEGKFLLAGALALAGDRTAAFAIIDPIEIQPADYMPETGGNLSSGTRTNAIMLDVLSRLDPENPSAALLAKSLMDGARLGHWYTTQENAFALMALGRYLKGRAPAQFKGTVKVDSDSSYTITEKDFKLTREDFTGRDITITIDGDGPCFYYWQISGVSTSNAPEEFNRGIKITRTYLDADGNPLNLDSVKLGEQVICRIEAISESDWLYNVVINDLLPAGLAVENPRLKTSPRLSWIPKEGAAITYSDIRDDRVLLFVDLDPSHPVVYHYSLRAVSAGEFRLPPVAAEAMYNPTIAGASSSGFLRIRGQR